MKKLFKTINRILVKKFPSFMERWAYSNIPKAVVNINRDFTNITQKRVLISYLSFISDEVYSVAHANWLHYYQMIGYFINKGYCVDLCPCNDLESAKKLMPFRYDLIIGFGDVFKKIINQQQISIKVLFLTENNPLVVAEKYAERVSYFKKRHPNVQIGNDVVRNDCFDEEQLISADQVIHMSSHYNAQTISPFFDKVYTIEANAIFNSQFKFDDDIIRDSIDNSRNTFLWFGSNGFIHKGVDLLLDAVKDSDFKINFYGISNSEESLFNALKSPNAINCGRVNVNSETFIDEIVYKHNFVVFPSCSEGMSTSVTTCMAHGIIPIVSKECGFDPNPYIIILDDFSVETIRKTMIMASNMDSEEIFFRRKGVYEYAKEHYTLEAFTKNFQIIMNTILK